MKKFTPTNKLIIAEVQVRTIFEEGYREIDYQLSYLKSNIFKVSLLNLLMLNVLDRRPDEMTSDGEKFDIRNVTDYNSRKRFNIIIKGGFA